jgi:hypothetical protein
VNRKAYPHGTRGRYLSCWQPCRCELCVEAMRQWRKDYNRRYRERRGTRPMTQAERRRKPGKDRYICPHCGFRAGHIEGHDGAEGRPLCAAAARQRAA